LELGRSVQQKGKTRDTYEKLNHTSWECKYLVVLIPKYRRKALFGYLRTHLGRMLHELAYQRKSEILKGHLMPDHVHMLISISPKYSISQVIGYIKGKSAIHIAHDHLGKGKNYTSMSFWTRGYFVSTVGRDEKTIRKYMSSAISTPRSILISSRSR
jgi:putative transposase